MVWRGRVTRKPLLGGGDLIFKRRFEIFKKKGGGWLDTKGVEEK